MVIELSKLAVKIEYDANVNLRCGSFVLMGV